MEGSLLLNLQSIYHAEARTDNQQRREGLLSFISFSQDGKGSCTLGKKNKLESMLFQLTSAM